MVLVLNGRRVRLLPKRSDALIQPRQGIMEGWKGLEARQLRRIVHVEIRTGPSGLEVLVENPNRVSAGNYRVNIHNV